MAEGATYWADWFWKRAGGRGAYPVDIGYAATCALELSIHSVGGLTPDRAAEFIETEETDRSESANERPLHGCIAITRGGALILVDGNDDERERRFTIAHEVAHYVVEVRPRVERAVRRLGPDYADVLYGFREPTESERIDAWLNNACSGQLVHLMDRAPSGALGCARTANAECGADQLALEILAPRAELIRTLYPHRRLPFRQLLKVSRQVTEHRFGLPGAIAGSYSSQVVWRWRGGQSMQERFGFT